MMTIHLAAPAVDTDPFLLVLLSVFGGAALTGIAGLIGAAIQAHREHKRWVLDHRYAAFVRAFALIKAFDLNQHKIMKLAAKEGITLDDPELKAMFSQADELYTTVADAWAPILILGPSSVSRHVIDMQRAYEAGDRTALEKAEKAFTASARKALKIHD